jgi:hypothetical protein
MPSAQAERYQLGQRIPFVWTGKCDACSGVVAAIQTDSKTDANVVYDVDVNVNGFQYSLLVKNGRKLTAPDDPPVSTRPAKVGSMDVTIADAGKGIVARGDALVGTIFVVRASPTGVTTSGAATFQNDALRDLVAVAATKSGEALFASLRAAAAANKKVVVLEYGDGFTKRAETNPIDKSTGIDSPGMWDDTKAGLPSSATVTYNPSMAGVPVSKGPTDPGMALVDSLTIPALLDQFGRPKFKTSDSTLFHELMHADDILRGRLYTILAPLGRSPGLKISEIRATGLSEFKDGAFVSNPAGCPAIYSENTYRAEKGLPQRTWYSDPLEKQQPISEKALRLMGTDDTGKLSGGAPPKKGAKPKGQAPTPEEIAQQEQTNILNTSIEAIKKYESGEIPGRRQALFAHVQASIAEACRALTTTTTKKQGK